MIKKIRLTQELSKLSNNANSNNITVYPVVDSNLNVLEAKILGPDNTPYEKGIFKLEILISDRYPFTPPSVKFLTKIYHPNIDDHGRICLDLLKMPPKGNWRPIISIEALLISIRMLLESPNPDDPLMTDIAEEYTKNYAEFVRKAKEYTEKYTC